LNLSFSGGAETSTESTVSIATIAAGYDLFGSAEDVDISLILTGKSFGGVHGEQLGNYIVDNIAARVAARRLGRSGGGLSALRRDNAEDPNQIGGDPAIPTEPSPTAH
jgi:hypothetical protein